nr:ATP-dependent DNA helicase [uncultured Sellimonas sp.]
MEEKKEEKVRISVRNLVEFILREGDLDSRQGGGADKEAMLLGGRIHRKIQRQMGSSYHAEVPLQIVVPCEKLDIVVEGRADGIIEEDGRTSVDEIKGILQELDLIKEPKKVHLAQAKCYAYIYAGKKELSEIGVQMTYCQMETEEVKRFYQTFSYEELKKWFLDLVHQYEKWAVFQIEWRQKRNQSIKQVEFPFGYREGQKDLVVSVYRSILRKKKLFIQAPTGVGKTMATVFPAVKAVGEELANQIFYLTAKTITRTVAEKAFLTLKEQGLAYKVITLTAKEKICFCEKAECNPDACPYAKGHFDRVNDAVFDMLTHTDDMSRDQIESYARKYTVCPFEMALDLSVWTDAVICDYNYVFDPNAHLKRFFGEGAKKEYLFLIDEAHNLVERGRAMYSASICKENFLEVRKAVKEEDAKLGKAISGCNEQLLALKRECPGHALYSSVSHLVPRLMNVMTEMERFLEECSQEEIREKVLDLYFEVRDFLSIHDKLDENYMIYTELTEEGKFYVWLFCVNPAVNLSEYLNYGVSTIFFSATLLPIQYYKKLLSTQTDDYAVYAHTPFPEENKKVLIGSDVTTRYTRRSEEMYERYARYMLETVRKKQGNYLAFFPSYRFLNDVYEAFLTLRREKEEIFCLIQDPGMTEEEREEFLNYFEEERDGTLIGFCVMGGIFSEGIDLTEERLIGTWIVGTGLPQVCLERELLKQYFDEKGMSGFEYAYLYPGMNKVLQAAGRVIRTDTDRGMIFLLDDRFLLRQYRAVFPREWSKATPIRLSQTAEVVAEFWDETQTQPQNTPEE